MNTLGKLRPRQCEERGNAFVLAMMVIMLLATFVTLALQRTSFNGRLANRDREMMKALAATDGGMEQVYANWQQVMASLVANVPTNSDLAAVQSPSASSHPGFASANVSFSNFALFTEDYLGNPVDKPVALYMKSVPGYKGWGGNATFYGATLQAGLSVAGGSVQAQVKRHFQRTVMPAIFYEGDLELHPGPDMTISGLVHTNSDLYAKAYSKLKFMSNVSYVGKYSESVPYNIESPPNAPYWADDLPSANSKTMSQQLSQVGRIEPFGASPSTLFNTTDSNPNNDGFREIIEPPVSTFPDPTQIAALRLYNQASVKININSSKPAADPTRVVILDGNNNSLDATKATKIAAALSNQSIYDRREATSVNVTSVDMSVLDGVLAGVSGFNGVVYIHDVATGENGIRLKNGAILNNDLTIASDNGVYIQGDFNTGGTVKSDGSHDPTSVPSNNGNSNNDQSPVATGYNKKSVAVAADAVMILSNNWSDTNSSKDISTRIASATTVNAAVLSGNVPTTPTNLSGGAHNFPRFLEDWSGKDFTYWGSLVQSFSSQSFTGNWGTGQIYSPPNRRWNFDPQFLTTAPPGSIAGTQYSRGRWERVY
jgi:hypothetical protein